MPSADGGLHRAPGCGGGWIGDQTYTRSVIEVTPPPGFLSVGQATAQRIARQAAERRMLGRTLLVHGPSGAGKDAFVADLLAMLFCAEADPARRPCNACRGCRDGRARVHPDLVIGSPDLWREAKGAGESIVAAARRWLLGAAGAPIVAERRIVLIERADRASEQIQNALLKALEEPGDRQAFILVADEPALLLPTIRSRCQPLRIGPAPRDELHAHLMDVLRLPADQADALARLSGGLVGTATSMATEPDLIRWRGGVQTELLDLLERGRADRFGSVRDLLDEAAKRTGPATASESGDADDARVPASVQRGGALLIVRVWLELARDLLVAAVGRPELAPSGEQTRDLEATARRVGSAPLVEMIRLLERIHDGLAENAAPRLALEAAMLAWPTLPASRQA
jgi:DNA polymerase III, delta subunit